MTVGWSDCLILTYNQEVQTMSKAKDDYEKGYAEGRRDSDRVPTVGELLERAFIPGTLPSEKGTAYKEGYDQGKKDG